MYIIELYVFSFVMISFGYRNIYFACYTRKKRVLFSFYISVFFNLTQLLGLPKLATLRWMIKKLKVLLYVDIEMNSPRSSC